MESSLVENFSLDESLYRVIEDVEECLRVFRSGLMRFHLPRRNLLDLL